MPEKEPPKKAWPLSAIVAVGTVVALVVGYELLVVLSHLVAGEGSWLWFEGRNLDSAQWYDLVRSALAAVGLVGLGGAAMLAYRRQRTGEDVHLLERERHALEKTVDLQGRFVSASQQLGHARAAVRLAGVYGMAALADDWLSAGESAQTQVCVDVLCAYMRVPYEPLTAEVGEREVRLTIISVIRDHLLDPGATNTWCGRDFDFTGALFDGGDFSKCHFSEQMISFRRTRQVGTVNFAATTYETGAHVVFDQMILEVEGSLSFTGAHVTNGKVSFDDADLSHGSLDFSNVHLAGGSIVLRGTEFTGADVIFAGAQLDGGDLTFDRSNFRAGKLVFDYSFTHHLDVTLEDAEVNGDPSNEQIRIYNPATVAGTRVTFTEVLVTGSIVSFARVHFVSGTVTFNYASFYGEKLSFYAAIFDGDVVSFPNAGFRGAEVDFIAATYLSGEVSFPRANFNEGEVRLGSAIFREGRITMNGASFSRANVTVDKGVPPGKITVDGKDFRGHPAPPPSSRRPPLPTLPPPV